MSSRSFTLYILDKVFDLQVSMELHGFNSVVLNDIATILYGLPRTINEIRLLVPPGDMDSLAGVLAEKLTLNRYRRDIALSLMDKGSAALNPPFMPIVYIVVAGDGFLEKVLSSGREVSVCGYRIRVPGVEEYISYMIKLGQYPYIVDGLTLLVMWGNRIRFDRLGEYGVDKELVCRALESILERGSMFHEVRGMVESVRSRYCA